MSKRRNDDGLTNNPLPKRIRTSEGDGVDRFSSLSDELLLQILSFLPRSSLITCQRYLNLTETFFATVWLIYDSRLSRRFYALGGDSELWKRQYYSRWVRPRARRLANVRRATLPISRVEYSPKVSTWLDHSHLAGEGKATNWKKQYRLKHNWARGICRLTEVELPQPSQPPMLVKLCGGMVFTADASYGLRAWAAKDPNSCTASASLSDPELQATPTALTATRCSHGSAIEIGVGFRGGRFSIYVLDVKSSRLHLRLTHTDSDDGTITAMASSGPYLLTVIHHKVLTLYEVPIEPDALDERGSMAEPRQIASLHADSIVAPMSLSLRTTASEIIASIVYSFFHLGCAWSLGIQELRLDKRGQPLGSQLATTVDPQYGIRPLPALSASGRTSSLRDDLGSAPTGPSITHQQPPTSISYSHPYLLTSHADNTLTLYMVVSTSESLVIRSGQRLWGHTSAVSTVQVSDRGKAVSVSARGDEIRVWELEPAVSSFGIQKTLKDENSIPISPENKRGSSYEALGLVRGGVDFSAELRHKLGGFDDERVLLLQERDLGMQLLECYDFT